MTQGDVKSAVTSRARLWLGALFVMVSLIFAGGVMRVWAGALAFWPKEAYYPLLLSALLLGAASLISAQQASHRILAVISSLIVGAIAVVSFYKIGRADMCGWYAPSDQSLIALRADPLGFPDGLATCKWSRTPDGPIRELTHYSIFHAISGIP